MTDFVRNGAVEIAAVEQESAIVQAAISS